LTPRKHKSKKTSLKEDDHPTVLLDLSDESQSEEADETGITGVEKEQDLEKEEKLKNNIEKTKAREGVIGYIFKTEKSASIDINDPMKIIDYAILSSSSFETSEEFSNAFEIGSTKHTLIEGNDAKLLSFTSGNNKVSVFMKKNVDHKRVYKDLLK
jgi:hypothetical protein